MKHYWKMQKKIKVYLGFLSTTEGAIFTSISLLGVTFCSEKHTSQLLN